MGLWDLASMTKYQVLFDIIRYLWTPRGWAPPSLNVQRPPLTKHEIGKKEQKVFPLQKKRDLGRLIFLDYSNQRLLLHSLACAHCLRGAFSHGSTSGSFEQVLGGLLSTLSTPVGVGPRFV